MSSTTSEPWKTNASLKEDDDYKDESSTKLKPLDVNRFATKKTIVQGMLDVALLTANVNQLKYILQNSDALQFPNLLLWLISLSIIFQICVGALFLTIGVLNINHESNQICAKLLNNVIVLIVFIISCINIIISGFGISTLAAEKVQSNSTSII